MHHHWKVIIANYYIYCKHIDSNDAFSGLGIHHFFKGNVEQFQEILIQLLPSLSRLANQTDMIWMNQYPILPAHKYFYPKGY